MSGLVPRSICCWHFKGAYEIKSLFRLKQTSVIYENVNTMSPLLTAANMHSAGLANYAVHLDSWAEWVMYEMPRTEDRGLQHITYLEENREQLWDDTLMMSVLPLTKIGLVLGRNEYLEEAKRQFLLQ